MRAFALKAGAAVAALSGLGVFLLLTTAWPSRASADFISGRAREKVLELRAPIPGEPVEVVGARGAKKEIKFGEKFAGDADWLKGAKFRLKNTTGKRIVFIELDVDFPETSASGAEVSYRINLGRVPNINHAAAPLSVMPGGEAEAEIDEARHVNLVRLVQERHPFSDISRARVQVGFVVFEDATAWSAGAFYRQDADEPRRWLPVSR